MPCWERQRYRSHLDHRTWVISTYNTIQVSISKCVKKECITHVENITTSPFCRGKLTKVGKEMNTATNIGQRNHTANMSSIRFFQRRDFVKLMISIRALHSKLRKPLNIDQMLRNLDMLMKEDWKRCRWKRKDNADVTNTVPCKSQSLAATTLKAALSTYLQFLSLPLCHH